MRPVAKPHRPRGKDRRGRVVRALLAAPTPLVFAVSVGVAFGLLWRRGNLGDVAAAARGADTRVLVVGLGLYAVGLGGLCLRWSALARMVGGIADVPLAAEAFLTSVVVNYAAPVGLAVPTRAALSKRSLGLSATATGALALWEVALDVFVLGLLTLAWLATGGLAPLRDAVPVDRGGVLLLSALVGVGVLLVAMAAVRWPGARRRVTLAANDLVRYPGRRPAAAGAALGLSVAYWALQAVILRLLLGAVGIGQAGPALVVGLLGPPILIGMLSPVPGGAGVREALMVAIAQAQQVDGEAVLLAGLAYRVALFLAIPFLYLGVRGWRAARERSWKRDRIDDDD